MDVNEFKQIVEDLKEKSLPEEIKESVMAMLDSKSEQIVVLDIKAFSDVTDYLIICNGNSDRHNRAIVDEVQKQIRDRFNRKPMHVEGEDHAQWILIDYADFVVHVFALDNRVRYSLEKLWMDGKRYNFYPDRQSDG